MPRLKEFLLVTLDNKGLSERAMDSSTHQPILTSEQLRQKMMKQADARGRRTAFKKMVWRYFVWISWSWVLPSIGCLVVVLVLFSYFFSSIPVSLQWKQWMQANEGFIPLLQKSSFTQASDAKEIRLLHFDHDLSDFSLKLLKEQELQQQSEDQQQMLSEDFSSNPSTSDPAISRSSALAEPTRLKSNSLALENRQRQETTTAKNSKSDLAKTPSTNRTAQTNQERRREVKKQVSDNRNKKENKASKENIKTKVASTTQEKNK